MEFAVETTDKEPQWLIERRQGALEKFLSMQMPQEREEDWRYTDISKLDLKKLEIRKPDCRFDSQFAIPLNEISDDLLKNHFLAMDVKRDKLLLLHESMFSNGAFVRIPKGVTANVNIQSTQGLGNHTIIVLEPDSTLNFIEEYVPADKGELNTSVVEIYAGEDSAINFFSFQNLMKNVYDFSYKFALAERNARINWIFGCFGGCLSRIKMETIFNGEGASSECIGTFLGDESRHIDLTTNVYHNVPNTSNNILARGVMKDSSSAVHHGLIRIEKPAFKTASFLESHSLLLGEGASSNPIPSLIIENNDVRATHGASVGQIDEDKMFYLTSRGISREDAERLIVEGFFDPVIRKIPLEGVQERFRNIIEKALVKG
ncbi:MAG: Fe-S cluster assembly protein SufD [Candidatus Aenigmarchaeota archaeon]|nr:Fe-S cluster assembly protein SufD [Candidatus Aenigmarchaeota archaeon]